MKYFRTDYLVVGLNNGSIFLLNNIDLENQNSQIY